MGVVENLRIFLCLGDRQEGFTFYTGMGYFIVFVLDILYKLKFSLGNNFSSFS